MAWRVRYWEKTMTESVMTAKLAAGREGSNQALMIAGARGDFICSRRNCRARMEAVMTGTPTAACLCPP